MIPLPNENSLPAPVTHPVVMLSRAFDDSSLILHLCLMRGFVLVVMLSRAFDDSSAWKFSPSPLAGVPSTS